MPETNLPQWVPAVDEQAAARSQRRGDPPEGFPLRLRVAAIQDTNADRHGQVIWGLAGLQLERLDRDTPHAKVPGSNLRSGCSSRLRDRFG